MKALVVFCLVLSATHLVQGITGFGAIVLALPVLTFFFPLRTLIPALVVVNLTQAAWFAVTQRQHLKPGPARSMVLLSLAGLPLGFAVYRWLPADELKLGLGFFAVLVAAGNLAGLRLSRPIPDRYYHALNFLGGVSQGALASGGPFLVIYAARMLKDKSSFRATLCLVWTALNIVLCLAYAASHDFTRDMVPLILLAVPCITLGTVLGNFLHDRIPQEPFRVLVYLLLLLSGLVLLRPLLA